MSLSAPERPGRSRRSWSRTTRRRTIGSAYASASTATRSSRGATTARRSPSTWTPRTCSAAAGPTWTQEDKIEAPFGACALEGDSLALGDPADESNDETGSVLLYRRFGASFVPSLELSAAELVAGDRFGYGLALEGGVLAVATPGPETVVGLDRVFFFDTTEPHPSFCDASDGALALCPCGNAGSPDSGCDIQQGTGGVRLEVLAQETSVLNRATLRRAGGIRRRARRA